MYPFWSSTNVKRAMYSMPALAPSLYRKPLDKAVSQSPRLAARRSVHVPVTGDDGAGVGEAQDLVAEGNAALVELLVQEDRVVAHAALQRADVLRERALADAVELGHPADEGGGAARQEALAEVDGNLLAADVVAGGGVGVGGADGPEEDGRGHLGVLVGLEQAGDVLAGLGAGVDGGHPVDSHVERTPF